jgi:hypothetical protein
MYNSYHWKYYIIIKIMTIGDFLIKHVRNGNLQTNKVSQVLGMDIVWDFYPDKKYQPGYLYNPNTDTVMGTTELFDRNIDDSWCT